MIELEEIVPYGIYHYRGKSIQLLEAHFTASILDLAAELEPIPLDSTQLWRLGFARNLQTHICVKIWKECKVVLKETKHGWVIQYQGEDNAGYLHHVHQVQRMWYSHFQEHLWLPKVKMALPPKPVIEGNDIKTELITHNNRIYSNSTITAPYDKEFYLMWDSRILLRSGDWVVWRVSDKNPLFNHAGKIWGLTLLHGKATEEERIKAGKWLKEYLSVNIK